MQKKWHPIYWILKQLNWNLLIRLPGLPDGNPRSIVIIGRRCLILKEQFAALIREKYPQAEVIAGVATGAIAQGVLVAQELGLPFIYVRSSAKSHGLENLIEGEYKAGQKVVVIEDLISTGGSSLQAVEALRNAECEVLGMVAIFTYGFQKAEDNFKNASCELTTLSNYNAMIDLAVKVGYVQADQVEKLKEWRLSPETYK